MTVRFTSSEKIAETSSKGNQEKWLDGNRWYKLDQFGYEALAETAISKLLESSNIETDTPFSFVRYQMERIHAHGRERTACSSENFLTEGQSIITLSHPLRRHEYKDLKAILTALSSDKQRIAYIAKSTVEITGLAEFPQYLTLLFEVDALFLNDDRHLNNIAVLYKDGKYNYCPIFDNGAELLSNTQFSPMDIEPKALMPELQARPFNTTFTHQRNTARSLSGPQLYIPNFIRVQIAELLEPLLPYYAQRDRGFILDRVLDRLCAVIMARQKI